MPIPHVAALFVLGTLLGSFLNVVAYRLPRGISVLRPRSFCPLCLVPIGYAANVPVLSFFALRGRCANCRERIPWRYPLVELVSGMLVVLAILRSSATLEGAAAALACLLLLAAAVVDVEHGIIPDSLSAGLLLTAVAVAHLRGQGVADSFFGSVLGGLGLWTVAAAYRAVRHRAGLGLGDVKLTAGIGMMLGLQGVLAAVTSAAILGTLTAGVLVLSGRLTRIARISCSDCKSPTDLPGAPEPVPIRPRCNAISHPFAPASAPAGRCVAPGPAVRTLARRPQGTARERFWSRTGARAADAHVHHSPQPSIPTRAEWKIGTAGSTTMLAFDVPPLTENRRQVSLVVAGDGVGRCAGS